MLRNYLKIAFRQMNRHRLTTGINLLGLAVAFTVATLIGLFIRSELSYDRWLPDADRIYRINGVFIDEGARKVVSSTPWPLAERLRSDLPEVAAATRIQEAWWGKTLLEYAEKRRYVERTALVDPALFSVFALPFRYGSPRSAWATPDHVVLSRRLAEATFGPGDPTGRLVRVQADRELIVGAVLDDLPTETHFDFDLYLPLRTPRNGSEVWDGMFNYRTYVKLFPGADPAAFERKVNTLLATKLHQQLAKEGRSEELAAFDSAEPGVAARLQSVTTLHTQPVGEDNLKPPARNKLLYGLGAIALIILLVALINFMNLATAHAAGRAKEVGIRKVVGATRRATSLQFFVESILQTAVAFGLALVMAAGLAPHFNALFGAGISIGAQLPSLLLYGLPIVFVAGLIAGSYPAVFLSRFRPVRILKGNYHTGDDGVWLRRTLVVGQFCCCGVLLLLLFNVNAQLKYLLEKDLGFRADQVVTVTLQTQQAKQNFTALRQELLQVPGVSNASLAERLPGEELGTTTFRIDQREALHDFFLVDPHFTATLDLHVTRGRFFTAEMAADTVPQYVVNEAFVRQFELGDDPVGRILNADIPRRAGPIVGVVKDFHWQSFTETIQPVVLQEYTAWQARVAVRIATQNVQQTLAGIDATLARFEPAYPPLLGFLDEEFARSYQQYLNFGLVLRTLSGIVLLIALLGLFGLAAYLTERRTKEIGIRKLLGASVTGLSLLMIRDFARLVLLAGLLALPLGWYLSEYWLREFSYRIDQRPWIFVAALAVLLAVAVATVLLHAVRAAMRQPVESLHDD